LRGGLRPIGLDVRKLRSAEKARNIMPQRDETSSVHSGEKAMAATYTHPVRFLRLVAFFAGGRSFPLTGQPTLAMLRSNRHPNA